MRKQTKTTTSKQRGIKYGYRSGLEDRTAKQLEDAGVEVIYEKSKIDFVWPERHSKYTPDFQIPTKDGGFFYCETKGRWMTEDRHKHLLIKQQHPEIDIRFVFSQNSKLYKGSPTTYSMWCDKHGFQYAFKTIPEDWLKE